MTSLIPAVPRQPRPSARPKRKVSACGGPSVRVSATTRLPTRAGEFTLVAFTFPDDEQEHVALVRGDVQGKGGVVTRVHSECLTGDAFGSLRCDCREQLEAAMDDIGRRENGIILYLRQEGRGIGLANKIKAYALQEQGYDTNEANEKLGFRADEREYAVAADMLRALGIRSIRLMTNNPEKIRALEFHGVRIESRIPHDMPPNPHNAAYLETKRAKSGHLLTDGTLGSRPSRPPLERAFTPKAAVGSS